MDAVLFVTIWGAICYGVAEFARSRGRSFFGFFLLSFIFSPLLGVMFILIMKNLTEEAAKDSEIRRDQDRRELERKREHEKHLESLRAVTAIQASHNAGQALEPVITRSIADELTKLAVLREKGILSPEEFEQQKKHLLALASL